MALSVKRGLYVFEAFAQRSRKSANRLKKPKYMILLIKIYIYSYIYTSVRTFASTYTCFHIRVATRKRWCVFIRGPANTRTLRTEA